MPKARPLRTDVAGLAMIQNDGGRTTWTFSERAQSSPHPRRHARGQPCRAKVLQRHREKQQRRGKTEKWIFENVFWEMPAFKKWCGDAGRCNGG